MTYGACFGDAAGAPYEYTGCTINQLNDLTDSQYLYTDDSVLTCVVAKSLVESNYPHENPSEEDDVRFRKILLRNTIVEGIKRPDAGWGSRFSQWLYTVNHLPYNSYGNGSAMRVSPVSWWMNNENDVMHAAMQTAMITHNHIEGIRGAQAVALAVYYARNDVSKSEIRTKLDALFNGSDGNYAYDLHRSCADIIDSGYHFEVSCQKSVPEALCAFLDDSSVDYVSTLKNTMLLCGDVDTQSAMTGAIAEAAYGMPASLEANERERLDKAGLLSFMKLFESECESYRNRKRV